MGCRNVVSMISVCYGSAMRVKRLAFLFTREMKTRMLKTLHIGHTLYVCIAFIYHAHHTIYMQLCVQVDNWSILVVVGCSFVRLEFFQRDGWMVSGGTAVCGEFYASDAGCV